MSVVDSMPTLTIEICHACSSHWIHYHYEFEAFSQSGCWYLGLIPAETAAKGPVHHAREILAALEW